jgi:hypothetical protein
MLSSRYLKEANEWQQVAQEMLGRGSAVTAFEVSEELRRRMAARGETPITYEEAREETLGEK